MATSWLIRSQANNQPPGVSNSDWDDYLRSPGRPTAAGLWSPNRPTAPGQVLPQVSNSVNIIPYLFADFGDQNGSGLTDKENVHQGIGRLLHRSMEEL